MSALLALQCILLSEGSALGEVLLKAHLNCCLFYCSSLALGILYLLYEAGHRHQFCHYSSGFPDIQTLGGQLKSQPDSYLKIPHMTAKLVSSKPLIVPLENFEIRRETRDIRG